MKTSRDRHFVDGEGYAEFLRTAMADRGNRDPSAHLDADNSWAHVGLVHYLLRSTVVLHQRAKAKHVKRWLAFSRECLDIAGATGPTLVDAQGAGLPLPRWAEISRNALTSALREEYPVVDDIGLVTTTDARLHARTIYSRNVIQVSALLREYLRTLNLFIWNIQFQMFESPRFDLDAGLDRFARVFLEHAITLYRGASPSNVAVLRAYSENAFYWTLVTTGIQLNFILAHEYAHIILHRDTVGRDTRREDEADAFAVALLLREPFCGPNGVAPADLWMALDWLFGFLELERAVGAVLNDYPVDWNQPSLEHRRTALRSLIPRSETSGRDHNLTVIGSQLLLETRLALRTSNEKGHLREYVSEWLELFGPGSPVIPTPARLRKRIEFHDRYDRHRHR
ncbi:ImmA/IrrE family metallo-endopeptidase [Nocardia takedensis]|uniref:ImmA/IrrE family metallo-endopeptidase n=1 Tax=Nocardia takedensis TaxID=259390 RepID=UPI003F760ADA